MEESDKLILLVCIWERNIREQFLMKMDVENNQNDGKKTPNLYEFAGMKFFIFNEKQFKISGNDKARLYKTDHFLKVVNSILDCKNKNIPIENFPMLRKWMEDPSPDTSSRKIRLIVMNSDEIYVEKGLSDKLKTLEKNVKKFYDMKKDDTLNEDQENPKVSTRNRSKNRFKRVRFEIPGETSLEITESDLTKPFLDCIQDVPSNEYYKFDKVRRNFIGIIYYLWKYFCSAFSNGENELSENNIEREFLAKEIKKFLSKSEIDWADYQNELLKPEILHKESLDPFNLNNYIIAKSFMEYIGKAITFAMRLYEKCPSTNALLDREIGIFLFQELTQLIEYPFFFDYAPPMFVNKSVEFKNSLACSLRSLQNPENNESTLCTTFDENLLVKTISERELNILKTLFVDYSQQISSKDSVLTKLYGFYKVKNKSESFLVMNNIFSDYINFGENRNFKAITQFLNEEENPNVYSPYRKDDFTNDHPNGLLLKEEEFCLIMENLEQDTMVLEKLRIINYGFLLGIQDSSEEFNSMLKTQLCESDQNLSDCLIPAITSDGSIVHLRFGIADILQQYDKNGASESHLNRDVSPGNNFVTNSVCYRERLLHFVESILHPHSGGEFLKPIYIKFFSEKNKNEKNFTVAIILHTKKPRMEKILTLSITQGHTTRSLTP